jgi:hypothetical protein
MSASIQAVETAVEGAGATVTDAPGKFTSIAAD